MPKFQPDSTLKSASFEAQQQNNHQQPNLAAKYIIQVNLFFSIFILFFIRFPDVIKVIMFV